MASIVTGILCSTVGLLWNAGRDAAAVQLKGGDVTDAKIREILVRDLNEVKTKLDGLSRKDLLSSYRFLKDGLALLNVSLDESKLDTKAARGETQSRVSNTIESGILNEALRLSFAVGMLEMHSNKAFESAKKRFEEARKAATHAFCNEALSIQDRIFASKLRVVSEILENLDSPDTGIAGSLSFLQDLHSLPAIRKIFSVYLNCRMQSYLHKAERVENVKSVMMINYVLFYFNLKFSRKLAERLRWPGAGIELSDRSFNPIFDWQEVSNRKSWGGEFVQLPQSRLALRENIYPFVSSVNGHGETVVSDGGKSIQVISRNGDKRLVNLPGAEDGKITMRRIVALAFDHRSNVYVVRWLEIRTENSVVRRYDLCILDENHNNTICYCDLAFLEASVLFWLRMSVGKNSIVLVKHQDQHVYVCDTTGKLKNKFDRSSLGLPCLSISNKDAILLSSFGGMAFHVYTEDGTRVSTVMLPHDHEICGMVFHYAICKIVVLTYAREEDSYFLLCYTASGLLESSNHFCERGDGKRAWPSIASHPDGPAVVARDKSITYI